MDAHSPEPLDFITAYLAQTFAVPPEKLTAEATFASLDLDSIAQVELFVTLSDHYGVELDDSQASGRLTLGQTADLLRAELARARVGGASAMRTHG
ncbi:acyl carrier protein [Streptomyces alboflavus]|uniref:acyl carrier protein n=1 Tax=Streptomyces alboflavus TaxID=67267 RepID=UPI0004C1726A|nr:acyl carrier protein [Streptomyces alboflavus]